MRRIITFDADTAAAVNALKREAGIGVSEAVNILIRRGLLVEERELFIQRTAELGLKIDVSNIAEALEHLDGPHS